MKSLTSRDAATGATLCSWTGGSVLGMSRKTIPATTMRTMMMNQIVMSTFVFPSCSRRKTGFRELSSPRIAGGDHLRQVGVTGGESPEHVERWRDCLLLRHVPSFAEKGIRLGASDGTARGASGPLPNAGLLLADRKRTGSGRGLLPEERTMVTLAHDGRDARLAPGGRRDHEET